MWAEWPLLIMGLGSRPIQSHISQGLQSRLLFYTCFLTREGKRGGTREGVEGASNKKPPRPCPNLKNPFLFAIISQGIQADIELRLKWGARGGGGERSREEGRGGRRREEGAGGRIPSCEVYLDTIQVALLNEYLILNSELHADLRSGSESHQSRCPGANLRNPFL